MGNICRSPMAEGIITAKLKQSGINAYVDSAGTGGWHAGEAPDRRAQKELRRNGLEISNLRARKFVVEDFNKFDFIFAMDEDNYENILSLARNESDKSKVSMFMDQTYPGQKISVPDPYYGGDEGFARVYKMLDKASDDFINKLKNK